MPKGNRAEGVALLEESLLIKHRFGSVGDAIERFCSLFELLMIKTRMRTDGNKNKGDYHRLCSWPDKMTRLKIVKVFVFTAIFIIFALEYLRLIHFLFYLLLMLLNGLIALIIALGFWGKASKEKDLKTRNASWLKVAVLAVLVFIVGVFFIKTYEIATIKNSIEVKTIKGTYLKDNTFIDGKLIDHEDVLRDSVEILLLFRFDNDKDAFMEQQAFHPNTYRLRQRPQDIGGADIKIKVPEDNFFETRIKEQELHDEFEKTRIVEGTNEYFVSYIATRIPSLWPIQPTIHPTEDVQEVGPIQMYMNVASLNKLVPSGRFTKEKLEYFGKDGLIINSFSSYDKTRNDFKHDITSVVHFMHASLINSMYFLTAADLTQCSIHLRISSDCTIQRLDMNFDIPTEILPIKPKIAYNDAYSMTITDLVSLKSMNNHVTKMHVKFPTMENLQLVRSLILTTILTALVSLLATNLFYRIRKHFLRFRNKNRLTYSQTKFLLSFWVYKIFRIIGLILIMLGGLFAWSIYSGKRYYSEADSVEGFVWNTLTSVFVLLIVLSITIWYSLRKVKRDAIVDNKLPPFTQQSKSNDDENFEYEAYKEEDYQELIEEE